MVWKKEIKEIKKKEEIKLLNSEMKFMLILSEILSCDVFKKCINWDPDTPDFHFFKIKIICTTIKKWNRSTVSLSWQLWERFDNMICNKSLWEWWTIKSFWGCKTFREVWVQWSNVCVKQTRFVYLNIHVLW